MSSSTVNIGWREWILLPDLGLPCIKAKIDTGAKTSCLHAFVIEPFQKDGEEWVRFGIHPFQKNTKKEVYCESKIFDKRVVSDSGGHKEERYVIDTTIVLGPLRWSAEFTLTNRDSMKFRMLLGRSAIRGKLLVDSSASYLLGRKPVKRSAKQHSVTNLRVTR